jgi:CubicO group peptidase (beta-lactamase class C family)
MESGRLRMRQGSSIFPPAVRPLSDDGLGGDSADVEGRSQMSDGGLAKDRLARMHEVMAEHVAHGGVPGLVTVVSRRGETHVDAIGAVRAGGAPMQRDSIFRITSLSKPFAAAAAMILVEEGKLRLDEPVDRLLPELADRQVLTSLDASLDSTVPANRPITLRDLLTFRLGLGIVFVFDRVVPIAAAMEELKLGQGQPNPQTPPDPDEWMRRLGTLPLIHQPGERWMYSTGADVAGVLIARAASQPLEAFLKERLFEPLGMEDTGFSVPAGKINRFTTSYGTDFQSGDRLVYDEAEGGQWSRPPAFPSLGGGLVSTVDDYLAFAQMLLNRGRHGDGRILSRSSVELMTADHLTPAQKVISGFNPGDFDNRGWGFCMGVVTRRDDFSGSVGAYGWDGGFGTVWRNDPAEDLTTLIFTNRAFESPTPPNYCVDFWALASSAIND